MRTYASPDERLLFTESDWHRIQEHQNNALISEINAISPNRLLNTSVDDLVNYMTERFRFDIPVIEEHGIYTDHHETQIDVSQDIHHAIFDRSQPFYVSGTSIIINLPFSGDHNMFRVRPTTYSLNPPRAKIDKDRLILTITGVDLTPELVRAEIDQRIGSIKTNLERQRESSKNFNDQLPTQIRSHIQNRRNKLLADQNLVAELGFPLKKRPDAPMTYKAPEIHRRIVPTMPEATIEPYRPEPVLDMADYEHILSVITNMTYVMERSPSAFETLGEEELRNHFLVQLNGQYEGQATGETFNYEGKTDILVRAHGRNIFIAECKYWNGPKSLADATDQILGYTSWRDTKTAIIIFNRRKNFSRVLDAIHKTMCAHANFKRTHNPISNEVFRYVFAHRDDPNRELILTVLAFDVPATTAPETI